MAESGRLSITGGGGFVRSQSASGPPIQRTVRVAVLPPRLPANMAPPTGLGPADVMAWDESINWRHNESLDDGQKEPSKKRSFLRKSGLTTRRKAAHDDIPPFVFREVPYETWRKHYAKDAQGRYHGTLAPAEDCLLLPEDVEKWRLGEAKTKADKWTRGSEALPVYAEVQAGAGAAPQYTDSYTDPPPEEQRLDSVSSHGSAGTMEPRRSVFTADGKTSEQIIAEAKQKQEDKKKDKKGGWKETVKRGAEFALLGAGGV